MSYKKQHMPRWFLYVCTVLLGVAFSLLLVSLAWNDSIDNNKREFTSKSVALKNAVFKNVRIAHIAINSLSASFVAHPVLDADEFSIVTHSVLQQHPYIEGAVFATLRPSYPAAAPADSAQAHSDLKQGGASPAAGKAYFYPTQQNFRDGSRFPEDEDLFAGALFEDVMNTLLSTPYVVTTVVDSADPENKNYWMLKALRRMSADDGQPVEGDIFGVVAVLVNAGKMLGSSAAISNMSMMMINEAASLSGKALLYESALPLDNESPMVSEVKDEGLALFPMYSIRWSARRGIHWNEIDKDWVYISLLIGLGVTLLMIALVRAKDLQTRELKARNSVIEKKVEEQTRELALARDRALEASRIKSRFLASMSHEIRTPLNAIIGMSELLADTRLTHEQQKYTDVFKKAGDTLLSLVDDILDLSKIEANHLTLEGIDFDVGDVIEEAVEIYIIKAAEKGVELMCHIDPQLSTLRKGDPARLKQIILNLIGNALKFTEQGEIVVSMGLDGASDDHIRVVVRDTGIGIPTEKTDDIFASFNQVDSSTTRNYGGTGLGLSICRALVEMMGGKIWVESTVGEGSAFMFNAALPEVTGEPLRDDARLTLKGKRILLIDDNDAHRHNTSRYLTHAGALLEQLSRDHDLADTLRENMGDYDAILLNCPPDSAYAIELLERINSTELNNKMILILHAAELNKYMDHLNHIGIAAYVVKPVKRGELDWQIDTLVQGKKRTAKTPSARTDVAEVKPLKILLAEDNPDNRLLIKAYLKRLPYELVEAENGQLAVQKFQQQRYNLVFMDVQMPIMDGHAATKIMRKWERQQGREATPIVALTAHAFREEMDKCIQAGCNAYLSKPVKKLTLIETIKTHAA